VADGIVGETEHPSAAAVSTPDRPTVETRDGLTAVPAARPGWHERTSMRFLATVGIVALATILGAVLVSQNVAGWIVGLVVGLMSATIAARLWSLRQI
jgi:hypothetical protein